MVYTKYHGHTSCVVLFFLKPPTVSPTKGSSVGRTCSPKNPTIDIQAKERHTGHVNIVAAECASSSSSSIRKSGNNNFAWLKHVHLCLSTAQHSVIQLQMTELRKGLAWLVEKNACASQIALTLSTLRFWGFWSSLAPHLIGKYIIPGNHI